VWPTDNDLLQMAKNFPIRMIDLKYQKSTAHNGEHFGAFQVILSNGIVSPMFRVNSTNGQNMQSINVPDFSLVKRINGSKQSGNNDDLLLRCLIFCKKDGTQIAKVETSTGRPYGPEFVIADSEEIIGI
jgi:hypothetical protein